MGVKNMVRKMEKVGGESEFFTKSVALVKNCTEIFTGYTQGFKEAFTQYFHIIK